MSQTTTYSVAGMTCEHCALSVTEEVGALAGVQAVDVDLASGQVAVGGEAVDAAAVRAAVADAGYHVTS
jgi:copper chaperone